MNGALLSPPLLNSPIASNGSPSATSSPTSAPTARRSTRACDACRRRKVRCNGASPRCQQCAHLDITCMYSSMAASRRSRKTAAPRGTVIAACRNGTALPPPYNDKTASLPPPLALPTTRSDLRSPFVAAYVSQVQSPSSGTHVSDHSSPATSSFSPELAMRTPHFVSTDLSTSFFLDLLPEYMAAVYPVNPIITEAEVRACIDRKHLGEPETIAFLYAYAALTINLSHIERSDSRDQVSSLVASCLDYKQPLSHLERSPSPFRIVTNIFLEICLMGLRRVDLAMMYLREAIGMVVLRKIDQPDVMAALPLAERARLERLYWECFIHERFAAVSFDKDLLLDPLTRMPEWDPTVPFAIHQGWIYTIQTFSVIDRDFVTYWLRRSVPPHEWMRQRHRQLEDSQWKIEVSILPAMQQADIIVTRQWLRTVLWQVAIRNMILSSGSDSTPNGKGETPSLTMPLQLSKELKAFLEEFSYEEVSVHGTGIVFKLFEITNAIVDVILQLPDAPGQDTRERLEDLLVLKKLILGFPKIEKTHRRILEQKFEKIRGLDMRDGSVDMGVEELVSLL